MKKINGKLICEFNFLSQTNSKFINSIKKIMSGSRYLSLWPHGGSLSEATCHCQWMVSHRKIPAPTQEGSILLVIQLMNSSIKLIPPLKV